MRWLRAAPDSILTLTLIYAVTWAIVVMVLGHIATPSEFTPSSTLVDAQAAAVKGG